MKNRFKLLLPLIGALALAACAKKAVYVDESFSNDSPFKLRVEGDTTLACESARRSLLGQGYLIELANSDEVKGRKATRGENTFIEMNIVCVPENNGSTIFAAGVLSTYDLKKSSSSASVGLSALGSISLPIGQSADSLVKVSEETIDDKEFYKRFFTAVDTVLADMAAGKVSQEPEATPLPAVEPAAAKDAAPPASSTIWPELFPEAGEQAAPVEPAPAPVEAAPGSEPSPAAAAPGLVHTPAPASPVPETAPLPVAEEAPGSALAPAAQEVPPATSGTAALPEEPSVIPPVPAPDEEPMGIPPAPDEEPMGIPPVPLEEPMGIQPQPYSAGQPSSVTTTELAPIETTAVRKVTPPSATGQGATPEAAPPPTPASAIDDLF